MATKKRPSKKTLKNSSSTAVATKKTTKKTTKKVIGRPFKKGQSGNPGGRPKGARDRRTVIWEALKVLAERKGHTPEEVETALQVAAIEKAGKGSFLHYAELSNGLYGKVTDDIDIKSGGKSIADLIALAHNAKRPPTDTPAAGESTD